MDDERMPKIDIKNDPKLSSVTKSYMKRFEQENVERVGRVLTWRKKNNISAVVLGLSAFGIYFYTMHAVKQERFLDDFDEPEKIIEKPAQ